MSILYKSFLSFFSNTVNEPAKQVKKPKQSKKRANGKKSLPKNQAGVESIQEMEVDTAPAVVDNEDSDDLFSF